MRELLKNFGAEGKEIDTFLLLLELGAQPAGVLCKQINAPRSTTYLILSNLEKLELVESFQRGKITYFKCTKVAFLKDLIKKKERQLQQMGIALEAKLPELLKLENRLGITPSVRHFEGKEAVMGMYERIIREEDFYAMFNPKSVAKVMPEYHHLIPKTIKQKGTIVKELLVNNQFAREYQSKYTSQKHKIKILPKKTQFFSDTIICASKIYMIAYGEKEVSAVEIENVDLARSQAAMFELLWKNM